MSAQPLAILGATGMLGQAICRELRHRRLPFVTMARSAADYSLDATDFPRLRAALDEVRPGSVVNAAAITSLDACEQSPGTAYETNARVVSELAAHCAMHSIPLVQISTDHYFTGDGATLHDERARVRLLNEYARTKYAGEAFASTYPGSLIVRTNIVGFRGWADRPTFVEWALRSLKDSKPMTLFDDFHTSSIDVRAFAVALFDLLARGATGLLNVAAREPCSKREFVTGLAQRLGLSTDQCSVGSVRGLAGTVRAESLGLDVTKAESLLGYRLPSTDQVIDALVRDYKEQISEIR